MLEPCVDLEVAPSALELSPAGSRLFGRPYLHHVGDWPRTPEGTPMLFVAQVSLSAARNAWPGDGWALPETGLLQFFCDLDALPLGRRPEDRYRFRVLWTPASAGGFPIAAPAGAPELHLGEIALLAAAAHRLPGEIDRRFTLGPLDEAEFRALADLAATLGPAGGHQLLGPPAWVEDDGRELCAQATASLWRGQPDDWRLLWQIDGEPGLAGAMGEDFRIHVMIRDEDLLAARFLRAWVVVQGL